LKKSNFFTDPVEAVRLNRPSDGVSKKERSGVDKEEERTATRMGRWGMF
jgi:hypothetical protein